VVEAPELILLEEVVVEEEVMLTILVAAVSPVAVEPVELRHNTAGNTACICGRC
jgi:hypothetical protein